MGLSAGIVGLPNVGKSTIFNAVSSGKAAAENYPFCTIEPNHGVVAVPDARLDEITRLIPTQKVIPAFLDITDIAGLVKGASKGEGLGNQFLGHIKNVDAIVHVVRCFDNPDIVHVEGSIDPLRDIGIIETELMYTDFDTVTRALERAVKAAKTGDKDAKTKLGSLEAAHAALSAGSPVRLIDPELADPAHLRELFLLSAKPVLFVANVDEGGLTHDNKYVTALREFATSRNDSVVVLCGKVESEIAQLDVTERKEFLESLGLTESGLDRLATRVYDVLGLATFFTAGADENRAWTIKKGFTAAKAAGTIHTDFEKGFIKAEVYTLTDLKTYKTEVAIRNAGKTRQEGREYVVVDGDIMFFKFNV